MPDALGLQLAPVNATGPDDLEQAFAALMEEQVQACVLLANTVLFNNRLSIAEMALANRLPGISDAVEFVEAGFFTGLWRPDPRSGRQSAIYVDKIIKGEAGRVSG